MKQFACSRLVMGIGLQSGERKLAQRRKKQQRFIFLPTQYEELELI